MRKETRVTRQCPCLQNPFDDCYCTATSSGASEAVVRYCGGDYEHCDVYQSHREEIGGRIQEGPLPSF